MAKRWVVKIGSALLTANGAGLAKEAIAGWVEQMADLRRQGIEVVLVSSGAVAAGMAVMGWSERPQRMSDLQAAAAIGQVGLVQSYQAEFSRYQLQSAQVLLVHDDLSNRKRYLNAQATLRSLLSMGVVPVINENDTVVTDEIRFGDNDTLGALVANLVEADRLIIMTDQDGLFDADPRKHPHAKLIEHASAEDKLLFAVAGDTGGHLGRGGMYTKVNAARLAARSGADTIIVGGAIEGVLTRIAAGEQLGTTISAGREPVAARKQWLAGHLRVAGRVTIDDGAVRVLRSSGSSLLPVGITAVEGSFERGEVVICTDSSGSEVARGLVNYSSAEAVKLKGLASSRIEKVLGYRGDEEMMHRDNMVIAVWA
ncbi:Glutamate 5-kinase [Sinobacterium norvegicum]|uniref:Glutamate 5-kinase n=1 Tax=Sinobacterium norvegicum TaxID=1641715 RepID=A0ABM9AJN5_9GAMM|nr:glutamate 5-kinase [Sinobacterium norvegicum]CAH0993280.1 Glutamate 5-kinase [Sinobacterium norvegicum]